MNEPTRIIAFVPDLMFAVRIRDVIDHLGYIPQVVSNPQELTTQLAQGAALVILDLRGPVHAIDALVQQIKSIVPAAPILAFGSHIDIQRQEAARAAGCDRVVANSAFNRNLPSLIQSMINHDDAKS